MLTSKLFLLDLMVNASWVYQKANVGLTKPKKLLIGLCTFDF